jgi:acyl dehydratase
MVQEVLSTDLVGTEFEPMDYSWNERDTMLYALAVGAHPETELAYLYERKGPLVLPSFAVIPGMQALGNLRQAVKLQIARMLHGEQSIELLRPMPPKADIKVHSRISEVWDKGKNGVIGITAEGVDDDGPLFNAHATLFYLGGGGFGGEPGPSMKDKNAPPDREPDHVVRHQTRSDQGVLYRLTGDRVALHIDPEFAQKAGYDKPFMHGLCTYGFVCRAIVQQLCDGDPARFTSMSGRFAERVEFEDTIVTKIWVTGPGEAIVSAENQHGGVVLSQASAGFGA